MKKKVVFVTKALWVGGIEMALINLLNEFDYDSYDVTLLVLHDELNLLHRVNQNVHVKVVCRDEKYRHLKLHSLLEVNDGNSFIHRLYDLTARNVVQYIENFFFIQYVKNSCKDLRFDCCIIYSDVVAEVAVKAIKAKKYIMFYHHGGMRHVYHDKIGYKKCSDIIAVSDAQASRLKSYVSKYADKVSTIHNIIDINGIRLKSKQHDVSGYTFNKDYYNIVTVGRFHSDKGMDLAVEAANLLQLSNHREKKFRWYLIGDGPEFKRIKRFIEENNLLDVVILFGMQSNPYTFVKQADLYVQTSRYESYGLAIAEALVLEKQIVSTNTDGAVEMLNNGEYGTICDVSPESICNAIIEKLEHKSDRAHFPDAFKSNKLSYEKLYYLINRGI